MNNEALAIIEKWRRNRLDGLWEHQNGLKLETTDNPGWLITVDQDVDEIKFKEMSVGVQERWNAQATREVDDYKHYGETIVEAKVEKIYLKKIKIRIYAPALEDCLNAAAYILAATA